MSSLLSLLFVLLLTSSVWGQAIDQRKVGFYMANKAGDDCSQTTLEAADTAAVAAGQVLAIPPTDRFGAACQWVITSNTTITSPIFFAYKNNTPVVQVAQGVTLTLSACPLVWGDYYIIDADDGDTGTVVFSAGCGDCEQAGLDNWTRCVPGGLTLGTLADGQFCTWDNTAGEIDCNTAGATEDLSDNLISDLQDVNADANAADDETLVGDGTSYRGLVLPNCNITSQKLIYETATNTFSCQTDQTGGTQSLDGAFDNGKVIDGANSQANALRIGNGSVYWDIYCNSSDDCIIEKSAASDTRFTILTDFEFVLYDAEGAAPILKINPDATSMNGVYQFQTGYQPLVTAAVVLRPVDGCSVAEEAIVGSDPLAEWITCSDTVNDAVDFDYVVTSKISGDTTVKITMVAVNKNAAPSGTFTLGCAGRAVRPGTDSYAAHSTTGEQSVSFTTFDTQSRPEEATATFTLNGTVATGAHIKGRCRVTAVPGQIGDIRLSGTAMIELSSNSWSD